ncbi:uncharacterized protein si:ch211-176l24.4 [Coregonus clupeaformis]|uniref:uncharacterized protein si:ch211-176l24.4 n=1 Tax=Coregonus clupeaformis TaxID=59861 RepID=UPI001BE0F6F9|nr:uncharacterized protein si:ch211-176l24.4 [Coregonus clupeaformis]
MEMAERAETEYTESGTFWDSPRRGKTKNKSKKDKCLKKDKTHRTEVKEAGIEKKKKTKKSKGKQKKKKKGEVALGLQDSYFIFEGNSAPNPAIKPMKSGGKSTVKFAVEHCIQKQEPVPVVSDSVKVPKKKAQRKKKVAFDLFPDYIQAKQPKVVKCCTSTTKDKAKDTFHWESPKSDNEINFSGTYQWGEGQGNGTEYGKGQDNSQSTAEDANSEDLFITQKKFRVLTSSDHSSSGGTGEANTTTVPRHTKSLVEPKEEPLLWKSISEAATQTENFFTSQISTFLRFHQSCGAAECSEQPTDLSLPNRMRAEMGLHPPSSHRKANEEETSPPLGQKSTDTTSSEENDPFWRCKSQVKAVQMRLNESFFFKMKGEGQSPRPQSPLMKLTQARGGKKTKK